MEDYKYSTNAEYDHFRYLDYLRVVGATNMYAAAPFLQKEFDLAKREAGGILRKWMETFTARGCPGANSTYTIEHGTIVKTVHDAPADAEFWKLGSEYSWRREPEPGEYCNRMFGSFKSLSEAMDHFERCRIHSGW